MPEEKLPNDSSRIPWMSHIVLSGCTLVLAALMGGSQLVQWWRSPPAPIPPTPMVLSLPESIKVVPGKMFKINATTTHPNKIRWFQPPGESSKVDYAAYTDHLVATVIAPGVYWIGADLTDNDVEVQWTRIDANQGPQPPPIPPVPPVPPIPPTPSPAPIAGEGLRVLIVYSNKIEDEKKLTTEQQHVIFGKKFRDLLNTACVMGPDGKTPERRILPPDVQFAGDDKKWADALARPRTADPWLIVSNGKTGYEGPITTEEAATKIVNDLKNAK